MEYFINCNTSTLAPFAGSLDRQRAEHLYRRLGFSASQETIDQATGQNAVALVNNLINEAISLPPTAAPVWADWNDSNYPDDDDARRQLRNEQIEEWRISYTNNLRQNNLRDRLSFFWSNHFVTEIGVYDCSSFLYHYTNALQRNAIGNFKTFISEIGLTSAMLFYLDGAYNNRNRPNENYARELYELFSLGDGNGYTEQDIIETARALTGYVDRGEIGCSAVGFNPEQFDADPKTILGRTGNWNYDDVIDILFEERPNEIAGFICGKLYEFFVHPDSKAAEAQPIIQGLATTFVQNNFEIAPVLTQLFQSQHFFDETAIGVIIKSPFDLYLNLINEMGLTVNDGLTLNVIDASRMLSQDLFSPVDVAGWQRDRTWINTNFIIGRWLTVEFILERFFETNREEFRSFGLSVTGNDGLVSNNPDLIARPIIDKLLPKGLLTEGEYEQAFVVFRSDVDDTYFEGGATPSWTLMTWPTAPDQVFLLLQYLSRQPEFQLK